jgi:hypothetical protein
VTLFTLSIHFYRPVIQVTYDYSHKPVFLVRFHLAARPRGFVLSHRASHQLLCNPGFRESLCESIVVDTNFRVILLGFSSDKGEYYIEKEFAELFKISPEKSKEMFRSVPTTIRENISLEEAQKYEQAIKKTGANCEVENMKFNISGLSLA